MSFDAQTSDHRAVQRLHAIAQCRSRYSLDLTISMYLWLCDEVWASGHGAGSRYATEAGHLWSARYFVLVRDRYVLAAWSDVTGQIATFLPLWCELTERDS